MQKEFNAKTQRGFCQNRIFLPRISPDNTDRKPVVSYPRYPGNPWLHDFFCALASLRLCVEIPGPIHEGVGAPEPAKAGTPNVCSPGFSRFVWRLTSKVSLHELALLKSSGLKIELAKINGLRFTHSQRKNNEGDTNDNTYLRSFGRGLQENRELSIGPSRTRTKPCPIGRGLARFLGRRFGRVRFAPFHCAAGMRSN
jgi:hypothetical protein